MVLKQPDHVGHASHICRLGAFLALGLWVAGTVDAQPVDATLEFGARVLILDQPRAIAPDPLDPGFFYVVEGGKHRVVRLNPEGAVVQTLGGPGSRDGQFDTPHALDATNGTTLLIADTENGRLQAFARTGAFLFSFPIGERSEDGQRSFSGSAEESGLTSGGRPVAVRVNEADHVFVADGAEGVVRWWDRDYRAQPTIGAFTAGDGTLADPIALALDERQNLYVLDRDLESVLVYDALGTYLRHVGEGIVGEGRSLQVIEAHLWVVLPQRLLLFDATGVLAHVWAVDVGTALVDVALHQEALWLLAEDGLYTTALPAAFRTP